MQGLPFLSGATNLMHQMASDDPVPTHGSLAAQVVAVADRYDLSVHGDRAVSVNEALNALAASAQGSQGERIVAALSGAVRAERPVDAGRVTPA